MVEVNALLTWSWQQEEEDTRLMLSEDGILGRGERSPNPKYKRRVRAAHLKTGGHCLGGFMGHGASLQCSQGLRYVGRVQLLATERTSSNLNQLHNALFQTAGSFRPPRRQCLRILASTLSHINI